MQTLMKIGIVMIILGIIMLFVGASMFTYQGNINPIISQIGMYSFIGWLPTIFVGAILILTSVLISTIKTKKRKDANL